jgi:Scavenger mRNA decapping enzyme C-term binding
MRRALLVLSVFLAGLLAGGYLFHQSLPRSFLALHACDDQCFRLKDLAGLLASAGIQTAPGLLPFLAGESNRCVAVRHPMPEGRYHMVYLPKRDLRNVLELTDQDMPCLADCLALAREDARRAGVRKYRLITNGPGLQHVTYMHFHVVAK